MNHQGAETHAEIHVQTAQLVPEGDGGGGNAFGFFLPLAAMVLLLYALVIRPQSRQQKEHRKLLEQIKRGDQVVTSGGIHGKVTGVADDVLTVEIADRVRIKLSRSAVTSRSAPAEEGKEKKS